MDTLVCLLMGQNKAWLWCPDFWFLATFGDMVANRLLFFWYGLAHWPTYCWWKKSGEPPAVYEIQWNMDILNDSTVTPDFFHQPFSPSSSGLTDQIHPWKSNDQQKKTRLSPSRLSLYYVSKYFWGSLWHNFDFQGDLQSISQWL